MFRRFCMLLVLLAACASRTVSAPAPGVALAEPSDPPRAVQAAPDLPLEGFWHWDIHHGFSRMTLEVRAHGEGEFVLVGYYSTDIGTRKSETVARREGGSLVMEATLEGLSNQERRPVLRLHPVRVNGEERLMPDGNLGELERGELPGKELAFRRLSPEQAAAFPGEWEREVEHWRQLREESQRRHESAAPAQPKGAAAHPAGAAKR